MNSSRSKVLANPGGLAFMLVCLITAGLAFLKYEGIVPLSQELIFAPVVAISLLAYGDKLLLIFFLYPLAFFWKRMRKSRYKELTEQHQTNLKRW